MHAAANVAILALCLLHVAHAGEPATPTASLPYFVGMADTLASAGVRAYIGRVHYRGPAPPAAGDGDAEQPAERQLLSGSVECVVAIVGAETAIPFQVRAGGSPMPSRSYGWDRIPAPRDGALVLVAVNPDGSLVVPAFPLVAWEPQAALAYVAEADAHACATALLDLNARHGDGPAALAARFFTAARTDFERVLLVDHFAGAPEGLRALAPDLQSAIIVWGSAPQRPLRLRIALLRALERHAEVVDAQLAPALCRALTQVFTGPGEHGVVRSEAVRAVRALLTLHPTAFSRADAQELVAVFSRPESIPSGNAEAGHLHADGSTIIGYDDHAAMATELAAAVAAAQAVPAR